MEDAADTDQPLPQGEHAINGYAEEKAGALWGELYADRAIVFTARLADLRHSMDVHDMDGTTVLERSQAQGAAASLAPATLLRHHILTQGEPGSPLRRLQDEPQLGVALLAALKEAVHDSQEKLVAMTQAPHGA